MEKILDEQIALQVKEVFEKLKGHVQILFFGTDEGCETCETIQQLLGEIAAIDDRLGLAIYDLKSDKELTQKYKVDKAPAIVVAAKDGSQIKDLGIQFSGIPSGHEFSTLINDILLASNRDSGLTQKARDFLKNLDKPLLLQVFVTPT